MSGVDVKHSVSATVRLPPSPPIPKALQAILAVVSWRELVTRLSRRYGGAFTIHVPVFGTAVVVTEPELARQVFSADPLDVGARQPNQISRVVGTGSVFALNGMPHRQRRDLLGPPLHGKRVRTNEPMLAAVTLAEIENWSDGREFETHGPMLRIALHAILHTVFGASGTEFEELDRVLLPLVKLGSRLAILPRPARTYGRFTPWGRFAQLRARYDAVVDELIAQVRADPGAAERTDMLTVLLRGNPAGTALSRKEIGDELLGLAAAGHETTAAQLAWLFERISRHPQLLVELAAEVDAGGHTLRRATIREVLRARSLSGYAGRYVHAPVFALGEWRIPRGCVVRVAIGHLHHNPAVFADPDRLDPRRFLDDSPSPFEWVPYGGGTRRCPGSSFANLEMDVVLRTVLQHFTIEPTTAPGEKWRSRGVAYVPARGGRITVHRRQRACV